jgi:hypothetical protein
MRLDCSILFFTVLMYLCTVEELIFTVLGCSSATVVTDNYSLFYVYMNSVSQMREQFFRHALTSIRNTKISPLECCAVYALFLTTS